MHTPPLLTHLERVAAAVILRFAATRLVERIDRRTREWNVAGSIERPAVPARLEKKRSGNAPIPRDSLYETPAPPALDRTRARAVRLPGVPRPGKPSRATAGLTGCAERTPTGAARVASAALRAFSASSTKPPRGPRDELARCLRERATRLEVFRGGCSARGRIPVWRICRRPRRDRREPSYRLGDLGEAPQRAGLSPRCATSGRSVTRVGV